MASSSRDSSWWSLLGLNQWPLPCQGSALPIRETEQHTAGRQNQHHADQHRAPNPRPTERRNQQLNQRPSGRNSVGTARRTRHGAHAVPTCHSPIIPQTTTDRATLQGHATPYSGMGTRHLPRLDSAGVRSFRVSLATERIWSVERDRPVLYRLSEPFLAATGRQRRNGPGVRRLLSTGPEASMTRADRAQLSALSSRCRRSARPRRCRGGPLMAPLVCGTVELGGSLTSRPPSNRLSALLVRRGGDWSWLGFPILRQQPQYDFVDESAGHPGRASQGALWSESDLGRSRDHREVVCEGLDLEPVKTPYGESVVA